jgi:choline dehydrogenase-like flavoprotein
MPKTPPDLPRLLPSSNAADRVQVQDTAFSYDVMGRYVCNDWAEVKASLADRGFPFDVIVVGAGMFGGYCAEKLYRFGSSLDLRILVLDAGAFLFPTHIQNLPQRLGGSIGGPKYNRKREDGSFTQNVIWGMPWISNEPLPGLAYCLGGRSLFWGGWSPRLTATDLAAAN